MIGILIVDDHRLMRSGLRRMLEDESDFKVVGEAANAEEALKFVRSKPVDVVLLDIYMPPGKTGLQTLPQLKQAKSSLCVIVVSMDGEFNTIEKARIAGADHYIPKEKAPDELMRAIRKCAWKSSA